jgi:uncharacterized damage-inducible protein DinB
MERTLDSTLLHLTRTRLLRDYPGQINECLDLLDDSQIWWRPHEQANAVANLLLHLSGSNRYYLEQVILGRDIERNRDQEFSARGGYSCAQIRETWEQAQRVTADVLNTLEPFQMMQGTDRTGKATTYGQILLHVTHHNATHMGQIVWITKMLHPGALDDIWMKQRER